jgi:hypothetical protein
MTEAWVSNKFLYCVAGLLLVMLSMFLIPLCKTLGKDYVLDVLLLYQFMDHPGINLLKDC